MLGRSEWRLGPNRRQQGHHAVPARDQQEQVGQAEAEQHHDVRLRHGHLADRGHRRTRREPSTSKTRHPSPDVRASVRQAVEQVRCPRQPDPRRDEALSDTRDGTVRLSSGRMVRRYDRPWVVAGLEPHHPRSCFLFYAYAFIFIPFVM